MTGEIRAAMLEGDSPPSSRESDTVEIHIIPYKSEISQSHAGQTTTATTTMTTTTTTTTATGRNKTKEMGAITEEKGDGDDDDGGNEPARAGYVGGARFWSAYAGLFIIAIAGSIDALIITTALPTILRELGGGQQAYTWTANCYAIAQTAVQPLFGQLADVVGRRRVMLAAVALFLLGSGLGGGASNIAMLIAGRTIQGFGAGGVIMLLDLITCDLVPLRQRPKYLGFILAACALGTCLGPVVGGAITAGLDWRWTFYINLPIAGVAGVVLFLFLRLRSRPLGSFGQALAKVDLFGNALFIASVVSLQVGLLLGGNSYPWGSFHTLLPIVLGALGWASFHFYQSTSWCANPIMPPRLFANRTSAVGFALVFLSSLLMQWVSYFMPLYFQILRQTDQLTSGVNMLPMQAFMIPAAGVTGGLITKFGRYKAIHLLGFGLIAAGCVMLGLLDESTGTVQWVFSEIVPALGFGMLLMSCLPSIQAGLSDSDSASSTATYAFIRSFGFVWSVTIPSIIFSDRIGRDAALVSDPLVQRTLSGGQAVLQVGPAFLDGLSQPVRGQVIYAYRDAFQTTWHAAIAFAGLGLILVLLERQLVLRETLETDFGLDGKTKPTSTTPPEAPAIA